MYQIKLCQYLKFVKIKIQKGEITYAIELSRFKKIYDNCI